MSFTIKRVITFWFNRPPLEWIIAPKGLDAQMKSEFGDLVLQARRNELDEWAVEPEGSVALVALLDQFSRNMFRGTAEAFSADAKACDVARQKLLLETSTRKSPSFKHRRSTCR
jgi:uncharacterized protein (DUF924 family)